MRFTEIRNDAPQPESRLIVTGVSIEAGHDPNGSLSVLITLSGGGLTVSYGFDNPKDLQTFIAKLQQVRNEVWP